MQPSVAQQLQQRVAPHDAGAVDVDRVEERVDLCKRRSQAHTQHAEAEGLPVDMIAGCAVHRIGEKALAAAATVSRHRRVGGSTQRSRV